MNYYLGRFIVVFVLIPLVSLGLLAWKSPRFTPIILVICPVIDIICYWQELFYYESRPFLLLFMSVQFIIVAVLACIIRAMFGKRKHNCPY